MLPLQILTTVWRRAVGVGVGGRGGGSGRGRAKSNVEFALAARFFSFLAFLKKKL